MRLIDTDLLKGIPIKGKLKRNYQTFNLDDAYEEGWFDAIETIEKQPTVEAEPIRHGKWKILAINTFKLAYGRKGYEPVYQCLECGGVEESYLRLDEPIMPEDADYPRYCPHCGALMDGLEEDE